MLVSAFSVVSAVASGLGSYNLGAFVAKRAIKRRRQVKQARELYGDVKTAVRYIRGVKDALSDGVDEAEAAKAKAIATYVKDLLDGKVTAKKPATPAE